MMKHHRLFFMLFSLILWGCSSPQDEVKLAQSSIDRLIDSLVPDKSLAYVNLKVSSSDEHVYVLGETSSPKLKQAIQDLTTPSGSPLADSSVLLPRAGMEKPWGIVTVSIANLRSKKGFSQELASQALLGTPVKVLSKEGGWTLVQTPDNLVTWVNSGQITRLSNEEWKRWKRSSRIYFSAHDDVILNAPNAGASSISNILKGSILESTNHQHPTYLEVVLPNGQTGYLKKESTTNLPSLGDGTFSPNQALDYMTELLGRPYFWGGTSDVGIDCSGLMKVSLWDQGIIMPRNSSQQALVGTLVRIDGLQFKPGDFLFFKSSPSKPGGVTHVGMYLGNGEMIHASGKGSVRIDNITDDSSYSKNLRGRLVSARRIDDITAIEQLYYVQNHPWYN